MLIKLYMYALVTFKGVSYDSHLCMRFKMIDIES